VEATVLPLQIRAVEVPSIDAVLGDSINPRTLNRGQVPNVWQVSREKLDHHRYWHIAIAVENITCCIPADRVSFETIPEDVLIGAQEDPPRARGIGDPRRVADPFRWPHAIPIVDRLNVSNEAPYLGDETRTLSTSIQKEPQGRWR
jgi:hypothetical protein